ncbi:MAG TPA: hypothetical protein VHD33_00415 [Legionellaceae bacterium]|nr:hypothetical protein [Legionellaceae bacterium]
MRHRLYREHKYVASVISVFRKTVGCADFSSCQMVDEIKIKLKEVIDLMQGHALHENTVIHELLRAKNSKIFESVESDHAAHADCFSNLLQTLEKISCTTDISQKIELGYQFYLDVQRFEADNLHHQLYEETVILKALQQLYTDEELLSLTDAKIYAVMTPEDMVGMLTVLFPYCNADDREAFLNDIYRTEPHKFMAIWPRIQTLIPHEKSGLTWCVHLLDPSLC